MVTPLFAGYLAWSSKQSAGQVQRPDGQACRRPLPVGAIARRLIRVTSSEGKLMLGCSDRLVSGLLKIIVYKRSIKSARVLFLTILLTSTQI